MTWTCEARIRKDGAILSSSLVKGASTPAGLGGLLAGTALAGIEYCLHRERLERNTVRASVGRSNVQHREAPRTIMVGMAAAQNVFYSGLPGG